MFQEFFEKSRYDKQMAALDGNVGCFC